MPIFPVEMAYGYDGSSVEEYTPNAAFVKGDFVVKSVEKASVSGADPAAGTILGISDVDSADAAGLTPNGKVPVRLLTSDAVLRMASSTTPVEVTHLGQEYGITKDGTTGYWLVDVAKTGASARVVVRRLDVAGGIWYVQVLAEFLAADGIDS